MILLRLFYEYFMVGLFAIGGGLATIPFLSSLSERTAWFSLEELANFVAIAESTPGPIGVNVATYVGYKVAGILGSVIATFGLILPSYLIITIIYFILEKFKDSKYVNAAFNGIRPASTGLILAALYSLCTISFISEGVISIKAIILAVVIFVLINFVPKIKNMHPIVFILLSALIGIIFKF